MFLRASFFLGCTLALVGIPPAQHCQPACTALLSLSFPMLSGYRASARFHRCVVPLMVIFVSIEPEAPSWPLCDWWSASVHRTGGSGGLAFCISGAWHFLRCLHLRCRLRSSPCIVAVVGCLLVTELVQCPRSIADTPLDARTFAKGSQTKVFVERRERVGAFRKGRESPGCLQKVRSVPCLLTSR